MLTLILASLQFALVACWGQIDRQARGWTDRRARLVMWLLEWQHKNMQIGMTLFIIIFASVNVVNVGGD